MSIYSNNPVSIHAAQAGCDRGPQRLLTEIGVSIHAAQAGCDLLFCFYNGKALLFQFTQPKRAATDTLMISCHHVKFQFTQPKRAATRTNTRHNKGFKCFNSRSPSGLRQKKQGKDFDMLNVSIHAAQAGCDNISVLIKSSKVGFNSRSPSGLRHNSIELCIQLHNVSIHAAQAGCDVTQQCWILVTPCFNSRSPSGLRQGISIHFNTSSPVSIHAAQAGCDS